LSRARDEFETLHAERPEHVETMDRLIATLDQIASTSWRRKRPDLMLAASQRAIEIAEEAARSKPDEFRLSRALARRHWFDYQRHQMARDHAGARLALERSIAIDEKLVHSYPAAVALQDDLARSLLHLSRSERRAGDLTAALASLEKSREIRTALMRGWPDEERCREHLAECDVFLTLLFFQLGRRVEGQACLDRAEASINSLKAPSKVILYHLACALSMASRDGIELDSTAGIDRASRAVAALERSVAAGYRDANYLQADPDFAPIRGRRDFQCIYLSLAFPADPFAR